MSQDFMSYDPWGNIRSRNGIQGDELVSMLQKSIRRGLQENALSAAYEMYITSPQFFDKMWRRILVISVEDIGFGNTEAPHYVHTLYQISREFPYADGDQPIFFMQAIRFSRVSWPAISAYGISIPLRNYLLMPLRAAVTSWTRWRLPYGACSIRQATPNALSVR